MSIHQPFYDSEEEIGYEVNNYDDDFIQIKVQEKTNPNIDELNTFLKDPSFIMPAGNSATNLYNLQTGINYDIPGNKINKFFDLLERIRRSNPIGLKWVERQYFANNDYSGVMIDLDIYQESVESQFDKSTYTLLFHHIAETIKYYFNLEAVHKESSFSIHIVALRRPKITRKNDTEPFKDGIHILIPGFQIRKESKKLFIEKLCNSNAEFFKKIKIVKPAGKADMVKDVRIESHLCIDKGSASVPVFLYGCERQDDRQPYVLERFIELEYTLVNGSYSNLSINDIMHKYSFSGTSNVRYIDDEKINEALRTSVWIQEFSLHWEVAPGPRTAPVIKKYHYDIRPEYENEVSRYITKPEQIFNPEVQSNYGDLDINSINDVETEFIKSLLDTLNIERAEKYETWFSILCVLAHIKGNRKNLAQYFSQKCPKKYNPIDFERFWNLAKDNRKNILNLGSLCYWAKQDNPERYKEVFNRNIHSELLRRIFGDVAEGLLGHFDIAYLIHLCLRYKYIWSPDLNSWFECITNEDDCKTGEQFKWRLVAGQPSSMRTFISVNLVKIFMQAIKTINLKYNDPTNDRQKIEYYIKIKHNVAITKRKLMDNGFKSAVIREAQDLFRDIHFTDKLDKCKTILPVANGILVLGERVNLISGYHNYIVSKFSPTNYVAFNPYDSKQKEILQIYRNLFPDNEPDSHEFFMSLYASSLDARPKDQIFCMKLGGGKNGKTMTTEIHRKMMGHTFATTVAIQFITGNQKRDAESATPATMALEYARQVDYQEPEKCETLNSSKTKLITGNGTISGRHNYGEQRTFELHCNHVLDTNYELKINDNSFAIWRRIKLILMAMRFHTKDEMDLFDEKNPYHRKAIENVEKLTDDPEYLSAYLAVLTWYYQQLQIKYNGRVLNVPHPHIRQRTREYRDRQNKLSMFYTKFLVRCNEEERNNRLLLNEIRERYERWFKTIGVVDNEFRESLDWDINNSLISNLIQKDPYGPCDYILGYRLIEHNGEDELKEGEHRFKDPSNKQKMDYTIPSENWEQYYKRICSEYDKMQNEYLEKIKTGYVPVKEKKYIDASSIRDTDIDGLKTIDDILTNTELDELIQIHSNTKIISKKDYKQNNISDDDKVDESDEEEED
jgi:phage/plasmid-associated DNA primase